MKKHPTPKLVSKLRFLCKDHPLNAALLKERANMIMRTIECLDVPVERYEQLGAYRQGALLNYQLTNKHWRGENKADA